MNTAYPIVQCIQFQSPVILVRCFVSKEDSDFKEFVMNLFEERQENAVMGKFDFCKAAIVIVTTSSPIMSL